MYTAWAIGELVKYKLPDGDKICLVKKSSPSSYVPYGSKKRVKTHYVELLVEKDGEIIYSAYDKNLRSLDR